MVTYYLIEHPNPNATQYRAGRRETATGAIVVHTTENEADIILPDDRAEGVAKFIARRSSYGSYHTVGDSDSRVKLAPYDYETWHVGTRDPNDSSVRANSLGLSYSFACYARQWRDLPEAWVAGAIEQAAIEFAEMNEWVKDLRGYEIPARQLSAAEYWDGRPGFISHERLDPGRRSDPGEGFPWPRLLKRYAELAGVPFGGFENAKKVEISADQFANLKEIQRELTSRAQYGGEIDGLFGPKTMAAFGRLTGRADDLDLITNRMDAVLGASADALNAVGVDLRQARL